MTERLGRLVHHDPESRNYSVRGAARPVSVTHRLDFPAFDQGTTNACTGFAAAHWLNCRAAYRNRLRGWGFQYLPRSMAVDLYGRATERDQFNWTYPPVDGGSSGLGIAKALQEHRFIDRYEWAFSFDQFLAALQRQPVLLGTNWYEGMEQPLPDGVVSRSGAHRGGHEYLARGILWRDRLIRCRNSWGPTYGVRGDFYVRFADMEALLAEQGDVLVPVAL